MSEEPIVAVWTIDLDTACLYAPGLDSYKWQFIKTVYVYVSDNGHACGDTDAHSEVLKRTMVNSTYNDIDNWSSPWVPLGKAIREGKLGEPTLGRIPKAWLDQFRSKEKLDKFGRFKSILREK